MTSQPEPVRAEQGGGAEERRGASWLQKFGAVLYIFFCFELGIFLVVFPWGPWWHVGLIARLSPAWREMWNSAYLRGAISGIGVVDMGIALTEVFRLRRFSGRA